MRTLVALLALSPLHAIAQTPAPAPDTQPTYKATDLGITKPKVLKFVDPEFSEEARQKRINGLCLVGLIVGVDGLPHDVHIVRCTDKIFEEKSVKAISGYRFQPAAKADGTPVAVQLTIYVNYKTSIAPYMAGNYAPLAGGVHVPISDPFTPSGSFKISMRTPPGTTSTDPDANGIYPVSSKMVVPAIKKFANEGLSGAGFMSTGECFCDVTITIDTKGKASNAELVNCTRKNLEEPAIKSLLKSKFKPGTLNGKPIAVRATIHLEYLGLAQDKNTAAR